MILAAIVMSGLILIGNSPAQAKNPVEKSGSLAASEVRLTSGEEMDYIPSFSPDGKRIAFASYATGNDEIWVMDVDGRNLRALTHDTHGDWSPAWSPDGMTIAFTSNRSGVNQLWLMEADGFRPRPLTSADPLPTTWSRDPAWSRDGKMIIFTSNRTGKDENWIMEMSSGKQRPHSIGMAEHWHPSFSPDGKNVLFSSNLSGEWGLWLSDLKGKNLVRLVPEKRFDNNPAASWSPDGKRIIFRTAESNLWIMNADGTQASALTKDGMVDGWRSSWSPDGKQIAYTSLRSGNSDIWLITLRE